MPASHSSELSGARTINTDTHQCSSAFRTCRQVQDGWEAGLVEFRLACGADDLMTLFARPGHFEPMPIRGLERAVDRQTSQDRNSNSLRPVYRHRRHCRTTRTPKASYESGQHFEPKSVRSILLVAILHQQRAAHAFLNSARKFDATIEITQTDSLGSRPR